MSDINTFNKRVIPSSRIPKSKKKKKKKKLSKRFVTNLFYRDFWDILKKMQ